MAYRNILTESENNDKLRKISKEVTEFNQRLWVLIDDMIDTMRKADGVGLAAIQVGVMRRVCIVETDYLGLIEMVNPVITWVSEETEIMDEGCLSVPNEAAPVERPIALKLKAQDRYGNFYEKTIEGFTARAVCHEVDHLDGILYIDKICEDELE